jgi:hypothetical protein
MRNTIFKHAIRCGTVTTGLVAMGFATMIEPAAAGAFTRGCAARDLQILMLIEERESNNTVAADTLNDAMLTMLEARIVCHEGHVADAMALYDSIARSVTPDTLASSRHR